MDAPLRVPQQAIFFILVQHAQGSIGVSGYYRPHELRAGCHVKQHIFRPAPGYNGVPGRETWKLTLHANFENIFKNLPRHCFTAGSFFLIRCNLRNFDFLQILFGLQLVMIGVSDYIVLRIENGAVLFHLDTETGAVKGFGTFNDRLDDHIGPHMVPGIQVPP